MTKNAEIRWLHISDFHFKAGESYDRNVVLNALLKSLPNLTERLGVPHFVVASGDIAHSGKRDEYAQATAFFEKLVKELKIEKDRLFVIPGNHDIDRDKGLYLSRTCTAIEADSYFDQKEPLIHIERKQRAFSDWYKRFFSGIRSFPENSTCTTPINFDVSGRPVSIVLMNSAIFCQGDDDQEKLWIGRRCLDASIDELTNVKSAINIAVMHHPLDWLNSAERSNIKSKLRTSIDCILSGHLHEADVEKFVGVDAGAIHLTAGAAYQTRKWRNSAMFAGLTGTQLTVHPIRYEDCPREVWTTDPSLFPQQPNFEGQYSLADRPNRWESLSLDMGRPKLITEISSDVAPVTSVHVPVTTTFIAAARAEFEQELFVAPSGARLYAEPRIMTRPQGEAFDDEELTKRVTVQEIVASASSFIIETRGEYGGTTLCKRLYLEFILSGNSNVLFKNARDLPNYRKKLETEFRGSAKNGDSIIILDQFDIERDDRLLKEIIATGWFGRIICVAANKAIGNIGLIDPSSFGANFSYLYLWGLDRDNIRSLAKALFSSDVESFIGQIVDKVYNDLLSLCIPLTPSNVIMYLRILSREGGEFHPLNRVDIVGRYIQELLRKPSDAYAEAFSAKNKIDVLSAFVFKLYKMEWPSFDDREWHAFVDHHKDQTLVDFDGQKLLQELIDARLFVRWNQKIHFKYNFFFNFFLGRYIASRRDVLEEFLTGEDYLKMGGVVDVITGLSSDNSLIVKTLMVKVSNHLNEFSEKYLREDFDPLSRVRWPDNEGEGEKLWKPVEAEIAAGPRSSEEINYLKTSLINEARTGDQEVRYNKFVEMESAIYITGRLLGEALRNSDDVDGAMKLEAYDLLLKTHMTMFQIGAVLAPALSQQRYLRWGGILFIGFDQVIGKADPGSDEAKFRVISHMSSAVASLLASDFGSSKLSAVFRVRQKNTASTGFFDFLNFSCILASRGPGWRETAEAIIRRTDKNAYYLVLMLLSVMDRIKNDVVQTKDLDGLKVLAALIKAKRVFGKSEPGSRAIHRMLGRMEKKSVFAQ